VLALLAEGRTNRQIGLALFITEKTASLHVSHILATPREVAATWGANPNIAELAALTFLRPDPLLTGVLDRCDMR
jgi:hypothetical protein